MSLYALFPGASLSIALSGHANDYCRTRNQPLWAANNLSKKLVKDSCLDNQEQEHSPIKPRVVVDLSKVELDSRNTAAHCSCQNSFSSTADETLSNSSLSPSLSHSEAEDSTLASIRYEQNLKIQVHSVRINFLKLTLPTFEKENLRSVSRNQRDARLRRRRKHPQNRTTNALSPCEKAIELELALQYAGRKYTAKRSFNQIAQLHYDLLQEATFWDLHKKGWSDWDDFPSLIRMGEFRGGFGQMDALLQSFRPELENWLQALIAAVSEDNPVLSDFLWEPLSMDQQLHTIAEEGAD